jgi:hypothetical protein
MEDLIIVVAVGVGLYLLKKHLDNAQPPAGAGVPIPTALGISTAPTTSAAYQTAPSGTQFAMGYASQSPGGTVPAPPPVPQPPPAFYGGGVGGVGSGGNPLGGSLRAGISFGTGTTVPGAGLLGSVFRVAAPGAVAVVNADGTTGFRAPTVGSLPPPLPAGHR